MSRPVVIADKVLWVAHRVAFRCGNDKCKKIVRDIEAYSEFDVETTVPKPMVKEQYSAVCPECGNQNVLDADRIGV